MADNSETIVLNDATAARLPLAKISQYRVRDSELPGFMIVVGRRRRTYVAAGEFWREGQREFATSIKLGNVDEMTVRDARKKAKDVLGKIARGQRPNEEGAPRRGEITLRQAWDRYKEAHLVRKKRGERTIRGYQDHMDQQFADWLDRPLGRLGRNPSLVTARHDKVGNESSCNLWLLPRAG